MEKQQEKITKLIKHLKNNTFINAVIRQCKTKFFDEKFIEFMEKDYTLTGLENKIIEVTDTDAYIRDGKPEDYITKSTKHIWYDKFTWQSKPVRQCMEWFKRVFPDKELLEYFLKFSASCLVGRNSEKTIQVWTGSGDNSKSMIKKLFEKALGSYCVTAPVSLITAQKRTSSSGPNPELARADGTRLLFVQEPAKNETINEGILKELTGGDTFFARSLHRDGKEIEATFKFAMPCNEIPPVYKDPATMKRMSIVPFLSRFADESEVPETEEEQFQKLVFLKDYYFENKIPRFAPAFLWIMVQYFSKYKKEGLKTPKIVKEHTENYWRNMDIYLKFSQENFRDAPGEKVSKTEVYQTFRRWHQENYPNTRTPNRDIVVKELSSRWNQEPDDEGNWEGFQIKDGEGYGGNLEDIM